MFHTTCELLCTPTRKIPRNRSEIKLSCSIRSAKMVKSEYHQAVHACGTRRSSSTDDPRHLSYNVVCSGAECGLGAHKLRTLPFKREPVSVVREKSRNRDRREVTSR